jgi:hypothetical protein
MKRWKDERRKGRKGKAARQMAEGQNKGKNKHADPAFHLQVGFSRPDH